MNDERTEMSKFEPDRESDSPDFRTELSSLLNRHSMENRSNTPDLILREYLCACLMAFDTATNARESWYGRPKAGVIMTSAEDTVPG